MTWYSLIIILSVLSILICVEGEEWLSTSNLQDHPIQEEFSTLLLEISSYIQRNSGEPILSNLDPENLILNIRDDDIEDPRLALKNKLAKEMATFQAKQEKELLKEKELIKRQEEDDEFKMMTDSTTESKEIESQLRGESKKIRKNKTTPNGSSNVHIISSKRLYVPHEIHPDSSPINHQVHQQSNSDPIKFRIPAHHDDNDYPKPIVKSVHNKTDSVTSNIHQTIKSKYDTSSSSSSSSSKSSKNVHMETSTERKARLRKKWKLFNNKIKSGDMTNEKVSDKETNSNKNDGNKSDTKIATRNDSISSSIHKTMESKHDISTTSSESSRKLQKETATEKKKRLREKWKLFNDRIKSGDMTNEKVSKSESRDESITPNIHKTIESHHHTESVMKQHNHKKINLHENSSVEDKVSTKHKTPVIETTQQRRKRLLKKWADFNNKIENDSESQQFTNPIEIEKHGTITKLPLIVQSDMKLPVKSSNQHRNHNHSTIDIPIDIPKDGNNNEHKTESHASIPIFYPKPNRHRKAESEKADSNVTWSATSDDANESKITTEDIRNLFDTDTNKKTKTINNASNHNIESEEDILQAYNEKFHAFLKKHNILNDIADDLLNTAPIVEMEGVYDVGSSNDDYPNLF